MRVAGRMARLGTESAFEVLARARALERAGREIVHLEIGEPDFDTPAHIKEAAKRALDGGATHYGPSAGLPELLEARGFGFDLELFERRVSPRTRLIIVNSPENPTGGVLDRAQLERIATIAAARGIPVLADEIYRQFLYEGEFVSITGFPGMRERTILLDGFSKSYAMTGWRLGYGVMPQALAEHVTRLMVNSASCTATFVQLAGLAALQGDQTPVARMVAEFKRRRDLLVDGLNRLPGVRCALPRGAFYVFPNIKATARPSADVAERLLNEAGVAVLAGTAFGAHGEGYLRLSYANSEANLRSALDRMRPVFESLGTK